MPICGFWPVRFLQLAARDDDVEQLIAAAHLHIGLLRHGVVALHQRVERLVQVDRLARFQPQREVLARQELLDGEVLRQA